MTRGSATSAWVLSLALATLARADGPTTGGRPLPRRSMQSSAKISTFSHVRPEIRSCYRWIGRLERASWKRGKTVMTALNPRDWLARDGDGSPVTFCWSNPVTGRMGGSLENYGNYLLRIDFVADAVIYDRSTDIYYRDGRRLAPEALQPSFARKVSSEIVYANYCLRNQRQECAPFFQEYMIRSPQVILSWSLGDDSLRESFASALQDLRSNRTPSYDFHFFINFFRAPRGQPWASQQELLLEHLAESEKVMSEWWTEPESRILHWNPKARR